MRTETTPCSPSTHGGRSRRSMRALPDAGRRREIETWVSRVRLGGVAFAVVEIAFLTKRFPPGYLTAAWALTGAFALGTVVLLILTSLERDDLLPVTGFAALLFDTAVLAAYGVIFSYEYGNQTRWALVFVVAEAALRYGLLGGILLPLILIPIWWFLEWWRVRNFSPPGPAFIWDRVTFPSGVLLATGLIVGWLVRRLDAEVRTSSERAAEAERLRDELGRRVDMLEATSRSARALGSSLEIEEAFGAFIREVRGLVPFDRTAIVLVEGDRARTIATAGRGAQDVFPPGSSGPIHGSVLERVLKGEVVVREDMGAEDYPEDRHLVELGIRSELLAPLLIGARPI